MSRIILIGLFASAFLIASALVSPAIETTAAPIFSTAAQAEPASKTNRVNKIDHYVKRGKQEQGGKAGLAVSDEGAPGTKPSKKSK